MKTEPSTTPNTFHPLTGEPGYAGDATVICPCCGEPTLHHAPPVHYYRDEDAVSVRVALPPLDPPSGWFNQNGVSRRVVPAEIDANPSARRHGTVIPLDCEFCGPGVAELCIAQHKGGTFIFTRLRG